MNQDLKNKLKRLPESPEGHWTSSHMEILDDLKKYEIKVMLEIGFNTGYSATLFLHYLSLDKFYSLDVGIHPFVEGLYKQFSSLYGDTFAFIIDDSMNIKNTFLNDKTYDLIFIDGCHKYEHALNDMLFSIDKAKYILLDDTAGASPGVTKLIDFITNGDANTPPLIGNKLEVLSVYNVPAGAILYRAL